MDDQKKQLLEKTYLDWLSLQLDNTSPLELLETIVTKDVMGYGTTFEEKVFGVDGLKNLIITIRKQAEHFEYLKFEKPKPVQRQIYPDNGVAIFVGEIELKYIFSGIENIVPLRVSTVMIFVEDTWKVTHWHASVAVETKEGDTFHLDELQLKNQKLEQLVEERTEELKQSIAHLKATQEQLIQSEKMASLGELTAGIAHEIQNPLNFVNNFSELSTELIDEMKDELDHGDIKEAIAISEDIKQNLEKINHHGKRADSIVKGMLQHSRNSGNTKEATDINALADEYMRLAYHGLRAKDKSFNSNLESDFDDTIEPVDVIPQDIGRVILNLFTNAFYAVSEKKENLQEADFQTYEPTVSVTTKKTGESIHVSVRDNGDGIPKEALNKIFQPFFTTKPTGKGTGLGLSMSYDIIKAHGGTLEVKTEKGKYTEFTIILPTKTKTA
jgi:signal transduction histidine kinase